MSNFSIMIWIICSILTGLTVAWLALAVLYVKERIIVPSTKQGNNVVFSRVADQPPYLVSVIVPARNEEAYIKRCLLSLLSQRYTSFEVIVIDDGSTDKTAKIVEAIRDKRLRLIQLKKTPDGWRGKSWASHVGYLASNGQTLLYTDADSFYYNKFAIARTVFCLQKERVDVVTGSPLIELRDFYSKLIMPLFNLFSVFRASTSVSVRDKTKSRFLIGGFFMIRKNVLQEIGGFNTVSTSIQEDTDLGKQIKSAGYSIGLVKVNSLVSATWSRSRKTLLEGFRRIVSYNLTTNNKINVVVDISTILCMVIAPFFILPFSLQLNEDSNENRFLTLIILSWNLALCLSPILGATLKGLTKYRLNPVYSILILFSAGFLLTVYLVSLVHLSMSFSARTIRWKGRRYT